MKEIMVALIGGILVVGMFVIVPLASDSYGYCMWNGDATEYNQCLQRESEERDREWEAERRYNEITDRLRRIESMQQNNIHRYNW